MNLNEKKYSQYALCREMLETADVVRNFDLSRISPFAEKVKGASRLFLTGEGSSRIFPAKRAIYENLRSGNNLSLHTDGSTQALEYNLNEVPVFGMSNSGRTKELVRLFKKLKSEDHNGGIYGITAFDKTPVTEITDRSFVLDCGSEDAVAATKSVAEQALFYHALLAEMNGEKLTGLKEAGDAVEKALTLEIDPAIIAKIASAGMIYFAGRNNGVAEELTLKTNEITRKKSDYLEGTYAAHGIEEVMNKEDILIVVDPFEDEEEKFRQCLADGVGMNIIAISSRQTSFDTVIIPDGGAFRNYVELAAGWSLLVETGIALGVDLDKPVRARKVGNEVAG
ncbi:SIS domain-containing protein [Spirochaeta isovalerica]|uniref:Glutamine--fructose-6-phosphate aminotransferase [isomerizing] n=1 Tax=Spirochaeta isovalerica TaxID=150 RepID=A0A841RC88_9SPIO|nr:SIS domain-containing protein [Spirochaeta isovalerica]MBB6481296.1 glucosamine--fructose-6-phosphate aminotransferase (isomerizing) [Spirochaeta isovalerica]